MSADQSSPASTSFSSGDDKGANNPRSASRTDPSSNPKADDPGEPRNDTGVEQVEWEDIAVPEYLTGSDIAHYHVEEQIGGGAMTAVFRARDTILERTVALKVLLPGADMTTRERFRREARTAAMLEHPNIVRTYQVGQIPETTLSYIAMELVNGPSLSGLLEDHRVLSPADAAALLEPIARALAYAHGRGVIHRDVKPSNILLQAVDAEHPLKVDISVGDGPLAPLLSDFGIARALDAPELTVEGRTIGTPAFMSPEQCAGADEIDGRADIYSLGAVLYRCLVGRPPYVGTTTQILHAHVYDPLLIPSDVLRRLPVQAVHILRKSMMKEPADRYASALEMAEDLAGVVQDRAAQNELDGEAAQSIAALPRAVGALSTPSHILVPARGVPRTAIPADAAGGPPTAHTGRGGGNLRTRLGIIVLSVALVALTTMMAITLLSGVLPAMNTAENGTPESGTDASKSPPAGGATSQGTKTTQASATAHVDTTLDTVAAPARSNPSPSPTMTRTPRPTPPSTSPTPTEAPLLEVSLDYAWENAQAFFSEHDWEEALTWLVAVQRTDPEFQAATVGNMLAETYVGLAAQAVSDERYDQAVEYLDKAADRAEAPEPYAELRQAVAGVADAEEGDTSAVQKAVQRAFAAYATTLADAGRYCDAADQIEYALGLAANAQLLGVKQEYDAACIRAQIKAGQVVLSGRILFSAVEGDRYDIFEVAVSSESAPELVIEDGAQPSLSPDGTTIAFYSRRPDMQGLAGFRLGAGINPDDRGVRYTNYVEDARDSAPSWNPQGDRLAYSSTNFGDGHSRIYLTWADGSRNTVELGLGKDPAWHPSKDLIVFNGADETGNNLGLWLMRTDGTDRVRLTDNGNDQRPTWTPDGSAVVFMSNGRDGNWELYRIDIDSRQITRLTNHIAQDGLPSVSPDGRFVAFMSDRDGYWRLWFVPVEGGETFPLANIAGVLPKWLEHAIQWVR